MTKLLDIQNISVQKGKVSILEQVSFSILKGDYIGLIGPNGAGKTTLLKTILKVVKPTSGLIKFSKDISIGYVPQKNAHHLHSPISVLEILQTGLHKSSIFKSKADKEQINKAIQRVHLTEEILKQNFQELSGGQQQRVLIARSLINQPSLLLFDEPFNGVDLPTQNKIYKLLEELNQEGVTIIFVSHDINTITKNCNRVLCLDKTLHEGCHPVYPEFTTKCDHSHTDYSEPNKLPIHHHNHS